MATGAAPTALPVASELTTRQLETHLAEYNALTSRLTYWITLQYVTYAIAGAAIGVIAGAWGHVDAKQLAWASILVQLCILWALAQTIFEIFTYVSYIERHLRFKLKPLLECNSFWRFERYLKALRRTRFISYEQKFGLFPLFASGILLAILVIVRSVLGSGRVPVSDFLWFGCCAYVAALTFLKFRYAMVLQKRAAKSRLRSQSPEQGRSAPCEVHQEKET